MNKVNVLEINYKNYGKCLRIANDVVEVIVTIEFGIRIVKYGFIGGKNHFRENILEDGCQNKNLGGHTFEYVTGKNIPFESLKSEVKYEIISQGVRFTQSIDNATYTQKIIEIIFEVDSSRVDVIHKVHSLNPFNINLSVCGVTSMDKGGIEVVPLSFKNDYNFPNKSLMFWPYSNLKDSRVYLGEKYVAMKICETNIQDFRIGFDTGLDYALYYNDKELFVKRFFKKDGEYPNKGCVYESFISKDVIEMRANSPIKCISFEECFEHRESWSLYKDVSLDFIDTYIDNYTNHN